MTIDDWVHATTLFYYFYPDDDLGLRHMHDVVKCRLLRRRINIISQMHSESPPLHPIHIPRHFQTLSLALGCLLTLSSPLATQHDPARAP